MMYKTALGLIAVVFIFFGMSRYFNTLEHHMAENSLMDYIVLFGGLFLMACVLVWNLYSKKEFIDVDNR